jgi:hypothetical protein
MDTSSVSWVDLLMQIPLAGIVVVVVMIFVKENSKNIKEFMDFIAEQRKSNNDAYTLLAGEVKQMAQTFGGRLENLEKSVIAHEEQGRARRSKE